MNERMNGRTKERTREEEAATYAAAAAAAEQTNQTAAAAEGKVIKSFFGAGKALRPSRPPTTRVMCLPSGSTYDAFTVNPAC